MSPNSTLCIYFPVHNDKIKTNTFNQKTKPYAIEHVSKKVKYNNIQLMMHRNHMLIMPQKHINSGLTDKSNITYTSKNKIIGKKLSKKINNTRKESKIYNKNKRWTHEPTPRLTEKNAPPSCVNPSMTTRRNIQQGVKLATKKVNVPKESSSATPNSTKPGKSSNPLFNEANCLLPYKTFSKFLGKSFQLVGQKLRIPYYCNNNDHVLSTRKKGKIRTGQKKVQ